MKQEEIKIRITSELKKDFQCVCDEENITMSNNLTKFIKDEVKRKKIKNLSENPFTTKLIRFDKLNKNKRIYSKDEFLKIKIDDNAIEYTELEKLNSKAFYGQYNYRNDDEIIHEYNATHKITNFRIEDDWLLGDVTILNKSLLPILDNIVFRPRSYGAIGEDFNVIDLDIIGFDAISKNLDCFNYGK